METLPLPLDGYWSGTSYLSLPPLTGLCLVTLPIRSYPFILLGWKGHSKSEVACPRRQHHDLRHGWNLVLSIPHPRRPQCLRAFKKIGWKHFYGIYVLLLVFDEHVTLYMSNFDVKLVFQRLSRSLKLQQVQKLLETAGPTSNLQMNN